jgi:ATP synthase protein I
MIADSHPPGPPEKRFADEVRLKAERKLASQRHGSNDVWFGLGVTGSVGWSVAVPAVLGALLGLWLDRRYPGKHSWTLALLIGGIVLGCANAWRWISRQKDLIDQKPEKTELPDA